MSNFHSSFTTASKFHTDDMNPPLQSLDDAISLNTRAFLINNGGYTWDSTAGVLAWSTVLEVIFPKPSDGKMISNSVTATSMTISGRSVAYISLSTSSAIVTATFATYSTASTVLASDDIFVLGVVSSGLSFYEVGLAS